MDNLNTVPAAEAGAHTHNPTTATGNTEAAALASTFAGAPASTSQALTDDSGNPTDYQIALWAREHGRKIKVVEVDGKLVCFKHPSRAIVEAANDILVKTKKASQYIKVIFSNCQLNFIQELAEDDELYHAVSQRVDEIITSKVATLKN
ncbi:MAG TPA: hypothetical protein VF598_06035 [Hymenobacter sp.]|jgi:hypothetical protein